MNWRLLDTGKLTAAENMALDETLLEAKSKGLIPNTIHFLQFFPPAALLGYHQSLEQEVRADFCKKAGIEINRRITGGGTIFFDETQIGWEIICDKQFFDVRVANINFFNKLSQPLIYALKKLGINASFRPRNDIEVNGKKISGTGGTEDGSAFLFQGTLLVDFDIKKMIKALRIPIAKLKDKEISSAKERVTCLKWELGRVPTSDELKILLKEGFEKEFNIVLKNDELTKEELLLFNQKLSKFQSQEYINKIKQPKEEQQMITSIYKADGGIIRISMVVNLSDNRIQSLLITGDFFAYPKRAIFDLEFSLKDIPIDSAFIECKIRDFFKNTKPEIPGVIDTDFINAINKALEKIKIAECGIPIALTNNLFTVNDSFLNIIKKSPNHLLLPYCAKSLECGYRFKRDCIKCGRCSFSEAFGVGHKKNMRITTILSFEDLMQTLERFKKEKVPSYIGCCCEAFYIKHLEDFEKSKIPVILIDISNKTCYELGKEKDAYKGKFESQTDINVDLLKKVLDVKL